MGIDDDLAAHICDYFRCGAAQEDMMYQIRCEDPIIHTSASPVCNDASCPCQIEEQRLEYLGQEDVEHLRNHPEYCLCDECAATYYAMTGESE